MSEGAKASGLAEWMVDILACPKCRGALHEDSDAPSGVGPGLLCTKCDKRFEIVGGIPRFVEPSNYAANFGDQWNRFRRTQLDQFSGLDLSMIRFEQETGWDEEWLTDRVVLDGGCGAGRFAAIAVEKGGRVVCLDLSSAVDACYRNLVELGFETDRFLVIQGSLLAPPIRPSSLDGAYSLGVVQHTPDPRGAVHSLCDVVRPGGRVAVWAYERSWRTWLGYKSWFRLVTKHLPGTANWKLSKALVAVFFPIARLLSRIPLGWVVIRTLIPLAYREPIGDNSAAARDWTLLDTFDNLAPTYDSPLIEAELRGALAGAGCGQISRHPGVPGLAVSGTKDPPK